MSSFTFDGTRTLWVAGSAGVATFAVDSIFHTGHVGQHSIYALLAAAAIHLIDVNFIKGLRANGTIKRDSKANCGIGPFTSTSLLTGIVCTIVTNHGKEHKGMGKYLAETLVVAGAVGWARGWTMSGGGVAAGGGGSSAQYAQSKVDEALLSSGGDPMM